MACELPPCFIDERELTPAEQGGLDGLVAREDQTGDTRKDLVAAVHVVAKAMRQHELDVDNAGAVLTALYRDVRSWRRIEALTGLPFTTARHWSRQWQATADEAGEVVDRAV